jgi:hypothetical protein
MKQQVFSWAYKSRALEFIYRRNPLWGVLWSLELFLTAIILLSAAQLNLESGSIQSIKALPSLVLFGGIYYLWLLLLLALLLCKPDKSSLESGLLVVLFALVFIGFWFTRGVYTAIRYDGVGSTGHVRYLLQSSDGRLPVGHPNLLYFNFPGMHVLTGLLARVADLDALHVVFVTLVSHLIIFGLLLYSFFLSNLQSPALASLGSLLVIQGNIMLPRYSFYPGIWALTFLLAVLLLVHNRRTAETVSRMVPLIFLTAATTITHLTTSFLIFFLLISSYALCRMSPARDPRGSELASIPTIALSLVLPLAWGLFYGARFFESVIQVIQGWVHDLTGQGVLTFLLTIGRVYGGGAAPTWVTVLRYFWVLVVFVAGTFLGLRGLGIIQKMDLHRRRDISGLVGILALTSLFTVLSPGGGEFYRFFLYGAFFTVPILLKHLRGLGRRRQLAMGALVALLFVLSLPTFLAHNDQVALSAYYPPELEAGFFLGRISGGTGRGLSLYDDPGEFGVLVYSVPNARFLLTPEAPFLKDREGMKRALNESILSFRHAASVPAGDRPVFYLSERRKMLAQHLLQVGRQDPVWSETEQSLEEVALVYDNHAVRLYTSP